MAESKRDYYEVLGVPKDANEDALKKHTGNLPRNTIRTPIQAIRRQKPSSKKLPRHTVC